jgi:hypothetical protein
LPARNPGLASGLALKPPQGDPPAHGSNRNRPIERHQPPAMLHRKCEQVDIGELSRAENIAAVDELFVEQRNIVGPEHVVVGLRTSVQMDKSCADGNRK